MGKKDDNEVIRDALITEFRGKIGEDIPDVDTYEHVDIAALTLDDPDPFFATLKIAEVGRVSDNGLRYDDALVSEIEAALQGNGVTGGMGHIDPDRADIDFPASQVHWIGSARDGQTLWAKGYVPKGEAREELRRRKAINAKIATSIWGRPSKRVEHKDGTFNAVGFHLMRLDLAPPERASLQLGGEFEITKEINMPEATMEPTKEGILSELTAGDIGALPDAVRSAIVAEYQATAESQAALKQVETERDAATAQVTQLEGVIAEFSNARFDDALDSLIAEITDWKVLDEQAAALTAFRKQVKRAVIAEMGDTRELDKIKPALDILWEAEFKPLAEALVANMSGPDIMTGVNNNRADNWRETLASPESVAELKKKWGVR